MKRNVKIRIAAACGAALFASAGVITYAGYKIFDNSIPVRKKTSEAVKEMFRKTTREDISIRKRKRRGRVWFMNQKPDDAEIVSRDGLKLKAYVLPVSSMKKSDHEKVALLVHGFKSDSTRAFSDLFRFYHDLGFTIVTCDQRGCGRSEGSFVTYGIKERQDICDWCHYIVDHYGEDCEIILSGISMGSTSVLMSLGTDLPSQVKAVIADCGYTSPAEIFNIIGKDKAPCVGLMVRAASFFSKRIAGFSLYEYSTIDALKASDMPVLFIHGTEDKLVPCRMSEENYRAARGEKSIVLMKGIGHGIASSADPKAYHFAVKEFLKKQGII